MAAIQIPMLTSSPCNETDRLHYTHDPLPIISPTVARRSVLHLVGFQLLCIAGKPLDQVTRDHVAWAAGKRRVGRTSVLQLLPLPDAIHCPTLPETRSGQQLYYHHILSPFHLTFHAFHCAEHSCFLHPQSSWQCSPMDTSGLKTQVKTHTVNRIRHQTVLTSPTRNCCVWDPCGQSSLIQSPHRYNNHHPSSAAD